MEFRKNYKINLGKFRNEIVLQKMKEHLILAKNGEKSQYNKEILNSLNIKQFHVEYIFFFKLTFTHSTCFVNVIYVCVVESKLYSVKFNTCSLS